MVKNIIIVANNLNSSARTSKCSEIGKNDIIVRFNVGWGVKNKNDRVNYVFFRKRHQSYIGFNSDYELKNPQLIRKNTKYIFLNHSGTEPLNKIFEKYPIIAKNHEILSTNPIATEYDIKPSSGLVAIKYFMNKFPDHKIKLFNFSWEGWSGHNFNLEQKLCYEWSKSKIISIISANCGIVIDNNSNKPKKQDKNDKQHDEQHDKQRDKQHDKQRDNTKNNNIIPYSDNELTTLDYRNNIYTRRYVIKTGHGKSIYRLSSRFKSRN